MDRATIEQKVKGVIAEQLDVDITKLKPTTRLVDDLAADSLDQVELMMEIEDAFDIDIADDSDQPHTVGAVVDLVEKALAKRTL